MSSDRLSHADSCEIPHVCLIGDLCRILQVSRTTIEKLRRHRAFPIPELPALDKRPRWSGDAVRAFLASRQSAFQSRRRSA